MLTTTNVRETAKRLEEMLRHTMPTVTVHVSGSSPGDGKTRYEVWIYPTQDRVRCIVEHLGVGASQAVRRLEDWVAGIHLAERIARKANE
jgi:hypothetical protein